MAMVRLGKRRAAVATARHIAESDGGGDDDEYEDVEGENEAKEAVGMTQDSEWTSQNHDSIYESASMPFL